MTVWNISFQPPLFIRSLFLDVHEVIDSVFQKYIGCFQKFHTEEQYILTHSFLGGAGNPKCHIVLKLNEYTAQKCLSLSSLLPDSIRNPKCHTLQRAFETTKE